MDYGIRCTGIHIGVDPPPCLVETQTDGSRRGQSTLHRFVAEDDALSIHASPLGNTEGNTALASSAVGTRIVKGFPLCPAPWWPRIPHDRCCQPQSNGPDRQR